MKLLRRLIHVPEMGILVPLVGLVLLFGLLNNAFLSGGSIVAMLRAVAFIGLIAVAQTWLMVAGEIDLSVGSVAGLSAIVAAWTLKVAGWPVEAGIAAGLATGALAGLINGLVAVRLGVPAFMATLGMLYAARGANYSTR
jgi:ribose transport system permease protein